MDAFKVTVRMNVRHVPPTFPSLSKHLGEMRRKDTVVFSALQVVLVTQYVCLIAQMLPEQFGEQYGKVSSSPPPPQGCLHFLQQTAPFSACKS